MIFTKLGKYFTSFKITRTKDDHKNVCQGLKCIIHTVLNKWELDAKGAKGVYVPDDSNQGGGANAPDEIQNNMFLPKMKKALILVWR